MAAGGIFDQLGGGFHRYSVDRAWIVPHFEKMLYDNAQLLRTYARSWLRTRSARHREVAEATAAWMLGEMRDPAGGFWSSLDADSDGVEGRYYVWSVGEAEEVTGADWAAVRSVYGFRESGNFEGANIPVLARDPDDAEALNRARSALLARRARRARPSTDTKVLTAWNALAASALSEAGALLGHADWVEAAVETMTFVFQALRPKGRLMRSYRRVGSEQVVTALGCCEDYAFVLEACLSLFEATFERRWLEDARWAAAEAVRLFADRTSGGFFTTGEDAEDLVVRPKDLFDNAIPSANSVLALELQRLALLTGDRSYDHEVQGALRLVRGPAAQAPTGFGHALAAVDFATGDPREIVVVGDPHGDAAELIAAARAGRAFNRVIAAADEAEEAASVIPLLDRRSRIEGRPAAYVCRSGRCDRPVTTRSELLAQLSEGP
jgi:uncharacterized protein YyaL (SSP411 family)